MTSDPIRFSVQAQPTDPATWRDLAARCETLGFDALLVADHPGATAAPFVALAAAATATTRLRLGTYVVNTGVWEPLHLAVEVATLDVVSGGRAVLGLGAGHTPREWTMRGDERPAARERVERLAEVGDQVRRLLAGQTGTFRGAHVELNEARVDSPRPVQDPVPVVVGGNTPTLLRYAARTADIVSISGTGRTLVDGYRHEVRWRGPEIDERVEIVWEAAAAAGRAPALEALVQHVEITDDPGAAAARTATHVTDVSAGDLLAAPYTLYGTPEQIAAELCHHRDRWGITRYVVREGVVDETRAIMDALADEAA